MDLLTDSGLATPLQLVKCSKRHPSTMVLQSLLLPPCNQPFMLNNQFTFKRRVFTLGLMDLEHTGQDRTVIRASCSLSALSLSNCLFFLLFCLHPTMQAPQTFQKLTLLSFPVCFCQILSSNTINIPPNVKVVVKGRKVTVTGPLGTLSQDFSHLTLDLQIIDGGKKLRAELWFGQRKAIASIRTCTSQIANMITGVTKGYLYKMRMVYAHFPIAIGIEDNGKKVAVRNFLGEKKTREVIMAPGVTASRSADVKDEIVVSGNDLNCVSQSAANIQQIARVTTKDIRKFLDGVYVSHRGLLNEDE